MAERLYGTGKAPKLGGLDVVEYTATIHDVDWVGALTQFDVGHGGIAIGWDTKDGENRHAPILGSTGAVSMIVEVGDTVLETFLEDLRTSYEGRFWLEITSTGTYATVWRGIIIADNSWETDQGARFSAQITAVDGLALLAETPYYTPGTPPTLYTGSNRLTKHITKCLEKMAHIDFWGATDPILETSLDWWSFGAASGGADDALHQVYVDNVAFYDFHTKGSIDKDVLSCYDVLRNILIAFGCRIGQLGGVYRVEQIDYRANSTYNYRRYDKSGNFLTNSFRSSVNTIDQTVAGAKVSYVTYDYLPQLQKTELTYEANLRRNFWGNIFLLEGTNFDFDQVISSNSGAATFRLRTVFFVNVKRISGYTGNPQDVLFAEIRLFLKVGSNYLKRTGNYANFSWQPNAASWTASAADTAHIVSGGQQVPQAPGLSASFIMAFDMITPPLPSDGSDNRVSASFFQLKRNNNESVILSEFEITWTAAGLWMEVYDLGTPDTQEDEVLYESTNPDGGSDVWEEKTRLGGGSANYAGRLMDVSNAAITLWGAGVGTRDKTLGTLLANTVLNGQLRPIKRLDGTLYGNLDPFKLVSTSDGIDWLMMRLTWSLTENTFSGTWFEVDYGTAAVAATPVKVKVLIGSQGGVKYNPVLAPFPPTMSGNDLPGFSINSPPTVLAPLSFNTVDVPLTTGDGISAIDILVAAEGNEFNSGDTVTIVHPITGRSQDFEIDAPPLAGDFALNILPATVEFDIPQGAFLIAKPKASAFTMPKGTQGQVIVFNASTWQAKTVTTYYDQFTETANFTAGTVVLALTEQPLFGVKFVAYNGQLLLNTSMWTYDAGANEVTLEFADQDVTSYPGSSVDIQIVYEYAT